MAKLNTRAINLAFVLGEGSFGKDGSNAVDVTGLRVSATVERQGAGAMSSLSMRVWGLPLDVMQKLSVLNILAFGQYRRNVVTVTAVDDDSGSSVVFSGEIVEAWVDAQNAPDVCFTLTAYNGPTDMARPVPPTSFKGAASIDSVMSSIALQMQPARTFENNGVEVTLDNPYFPGTLFDQMKAAADAAKCQYYLDDKVLAIWPVGKTREALGTLQLSAETGLIGYPTFASTGVALQMLYSPRIAFGQKIQLKSALGSPADGEWEVLRVIHNIEAEIPGGQWFTAVDCGRVGYPPPIIG